MAKSNSRRPSNQVQKAKVKKANSFPLFRHRRGHWAKKVKGKTRYFGLIADDPTGQKALDLWLVQKDDLMAGRKPRETGPGMLGLGDGFNLFLDYLDEKADNGELSRRWYEDAKHTCNVALKVLGRTWSIESLRPDDFSELAKKFWATGRGGKKASPVSVQNRIHRIKSAFNWLVRAGHIDRPPAYGMAFSPPKKIVVDRHRDNQQSRYFDRRQVRALLRETKDSRPRMYVAILLAINTGCQNEDIETLRFRHLDLKSGWYYQPRSKKAKKRRAKLWPRTVKALRRYIADRTTHPDELVFLAKTGGAWAGRNCLAKEFAKVKEAAGITAERSGYQWLRHSFITEASQTGDQVAVQLACGHASRSITENYIHRIYDPRLVAISETVEKWLMGK